MSRYFDDPSERALAERIWQAARQQDLQTLATPELVRLVDARLDPRRFAELPWVDQTICKAALLSSLVRNSEASGDSPVLAPLVAGLNLASSHLSDVQHFFWAALATQATTFNAALVARLYEEIIRDLPWLRQRRERDLPPQLRSAWTPAAEQARLRWNVRQFVGPDLKGLYFGTALARLVGDR